MFLISSTTDILKVKPFCSSFYLITQTLKDNYIIKIETFFNLLDVKNINSKYNSNFALPYHSIFYS